MKRIACTLVGIVLSLSALMGQQNQIDSLHQLLAKTKGEDRIKVLHALVINLWLNFPDSAKVYAQDALRSSNELKDIKLLSISNRLLGGVYAYTSNYDSCKFYLEKGLHLAFESRDSTLIASAANNVGYCNLLMGNYPEALEYLFIAYNIRQKIHQLYGRGHTLNNIGLVYTKLGDFNTAREYLNEALKVADDNIRIYSYNNLAATYLAEKNFSEAEKFYLKAVEVNMTMLTDNRQWVATAFDGLGQVYNGRHMDTKAKAYFNDALALSKSIHNKKGESEIYYHISQLYASINIDTAFYYLRESHHMAVILNAKDNLLDNYSQFRVLFQLKHRLDSAVYYQSKYDELKHQQYIDNTRRSAESVVLKMKGDELQKELVIKNAQISEKEGKVKLFWIVAILSLTSLGVSFRFFRVQKKLGHQLTMRHEEISRQQLEIEIKNQQLEQNLNELKRAQGQLVQTKKMASLGVLTAGIAHEINNPVNFITVGVAALEKRLHQFDNYINGNGVNSSEGFLSEQEKINQLVKDIRTGTSRTEEIISSLRTFSRLDEGELIITDVNALIESTLVILNSKIQDRITIAKLLGNDLPQVLCRPGQIKQVFLHVIANAIDAIEDKGRILISSKLIENKVEIRVLDSGKGMPSEVLEKIFEPFFTTKAIGDGTGLGLSISYGIIKQHHGNISVTSEFGVGSEFIIQLPAYDNAHSSREEFNGMLKTLG